MSRSPRRRYRKAADRRVWVFSELRHDLRPEQIASIITAAGLEQARLEAEAAAELAARNAEAKEDANEVESLEERLDA